MKKTKPPFKVGDVVYIKPIGHKIDEMDDCSFLITAIKCDRDYDGGFKVKTKPCMFGCGDNYVCSSYFQKSKPLEILEVF